MARETGRRLLGRRRETEVLEGLLADVVAGRGRVLVVRGAGGVGKSALLGWLAGRAEQVGGDVGGAVRGAAAGEGGRVRAVRVVRVSGVEYEAGFAYSALQRVCDPFVGLLERLPVAEREALGVVFGVSAGGVPDAGALAALFGAAGGPTLFLIDDAQWLDRESRELLAAVEAEGVGVVFAEDGCALAGLPELRVDGLGAADAGALLDGTLSAPIDPRVRERIVAEAAGNPLALLDLSPTESGFGFGGSAVGGVRSRFEEEIGALSDDARMLATLIAVEPTGDRGLVRRAADVLGLEGDASGLLAAGDPLRFKDALIRRAVWQRTDAAALRRAHRALAEAIDAEAEPDRHAWYLAHAAVGTDERAAAALEEAAHQALGGGSAAGRSGEAADQSAEAAGRSSEEAGRKTSAEQSVSAAPAGRTAWRIARPTAAAFLERAVALTPDPAERTRRALAAARALVDAGAPARVSELLDAAGLGPMDALQQADAARLRAKAAYLLNPGAGAVAPLLAASGRLARLDPVAARETQLAALEAAIWTGRLDEREVRRVAEAALALPPGDEVAGILLRAFTAWALDGFEDAVPLLAEALRAFSDADVPGLLWSVVNAAVVLGDVRMWLDVTGRAVRFAQATGQVSVLPTALTNRAVALGHSGRFDEARVALAEAEAADGVTGQRSHIVAAVMLGAYQGRESEALALIEALEHDGRRRGLGRLIGGAEYARAVLYNGLGNYPVALEAALRGIAFRNMSVHHWTLTELIEAAVRSGAPAAAAQAREQLAGWSSAGTPWALGAHALADALTAKTEDRTESLYREAVEHYTAGGLGALEARARLLYGEWLRRQNRRAQARTELRTAHEAFTAMGMEAFAERAHREQLATGETVRRRGADTTGLTPQENQIARLAVHGASNAEIGAQMYLSPRTVEWHLRKVFTKLGIASRRELEDALSDEDGFEA